jgi:1-acyl-sn-glycerol-3-phosphate acyltransferase
VDRLAGAAARAHRDRVVIGLEDVHVKRWVALGGGPLRLKTELADAGPDLVDVTLLAWRDAATAELSRYEPVATGRVRLGGAYPAPPAALPVPADAAPVPNPYESGQMFHGPAFQVLRSLQVGEAAASAVVSAASGAPTGTLNQVLLDGVTHTFPGDDLTRWSKDVPAGMVGYPSRLTALTLHGHTPVTGEVRVETRFDGFGQDDPRFPAFKFQVIVGDQVWADGRIVYILFPKGPLGEAAAGDRRAFLAERKAVPGMGLTTQDGDATRLAIADVRGSDWLPGTLARIYNAEGDMEALARQIAIKEHLARKWDVHPGTVYASETGGAGPAEPLTAYPVTVEQDGEIITVCDAGEPRLDPAPIKAYWRRKLGKADWPVEDLYFGLIERFVRKVVVTNPAAFQQVQGRSVLYLANHQVGLESLLFSVIAAGLTGVPTAILAKTEHQTSWLGELIYHNFGYPGVNDPRLIKFFDRQDPASLPKIVAALKQEMVGEGKSLMVHAAGTRSLAARQPVPAPSAAFIDLALEAGLPIVPVRFAGGLPVEPLAERLEFPLGYGTQDYYFGAPLWPEELAALPLAARKQTVADALNQLGPDLALEEPNAPDPAFTAELAGYRSRVDVGEVPAVMFKTLEHLDRPCAGTKELLGAVRAQRDLPTDTPELRWMGMIADWLSGKRERLLGGRKGGI